MAQCAATSGGGSSFDIGSAFKKGWDSFWKTAFGILKDNMDYTYWVLKNIFGDSVRFGFDGIGNMWCKNVRYMVHVDLLKRPINQFKPVHQST